VVKKKFTWTALLSSNWLSFCQLFHHCSRFILLSFEGQSLGLLHASVIADMRKMKLILRLHRIRTGGHEEPAMSTHSMQAFHIVSFLGKAYSYYYCPLGSGKVSTLKCGKENIGLLIELFL
jgi:hypothetical protein